MNIQQISVFLENNAGRLANVALILKENKINVARSPSPTRRISASSA